MKNLDELIMLVAMAALAILAAFVLSRPADASELHLVELDRFSMETAKIVNYNDPYYPYADPKGATGEHWESYTAVNFNLDLASYDGYELYMDNKVDGASTSSQFRSVSWEWEAGFDAHDHVQLFWHHHSSHVLDDARDMHFPLTNMYGIRCTFYQRNPS